MQNLFLRWSKYKIVFWFIIAFKLIEVFILEKIPNVVQQFSQNEIWPYLMSIIVFSALLLHYFCFRKEYGSKLKNLQNDLRVLAILRWVMFIPETISIIVIFLSIAAIAYNIETNQFIMAVNNEIVYAFFFVPLVDFYLFFIIDRKSKNPNSSLFTLIKEMFGKHSQVKRLITTMILIIIGSILTSYGFYEISESMTTNNQPPSIPPSTINESSTEVIEYPNQDWLNYFSIDRYPIQGDFEPNNRIVFRIYAATTHPVAEFYATIFHSDFKDVFKTTHNLAEGNSENPSPTHVPLYENDWVFNTVMNYTGYSNSDCVSLLNQTNYALINTPSDCEFSYNGFNTYSFKYPGNYMVQFAIKERDGTIRAYESPMTIFNIPDPRELQIQNNVDKIYNIAQVSQNTSTRSEGLSLVALGSSLIIAGVSMRDTMITNEKWSIQEENRKNRTKNLIQILSTPLIVITLQSLTREDRAKEFNKDPVAYKENEVIIMECETTLARAAEELKMARQLSLLPTEIEELLRKVSLEATKKLSKDGKSGKYFLLNHDKLKKMIDDLEKELRKFKNTIEQD